MEELYFCLHQNFGTSNISATFEAICGKWSANNTVWYVSTEIWITKLMLFNNIGRVLVLDIKFVLPTKARHFFLTGFIPVSLI